MSRYILGCFTWSQIADVVLGISGVGSNDFKKHFPERDTVRSRDGCNETIMQYKFKHHAILEQGEFPTLEQYPEFSEDEEFVEEFQRLFSNEDIAESDN